MTMATRPSQGRPQPARRPAESKKHGITPELKAALLGAPQSFVVDNDLYEISAPWWPALLLVGDENNRWCLPFLLAVTHPDDVRLLATRLLDPDDPLVTDDVADVSQALVERATGRGWWVAARLAAVINHSWAAIDGRLMGRGVDLLSVLQASPDRAFNLVTYMLYEYADDKKRNRLDTDLLRPPRGVARQRRSLQEDAAAFEDAFSSPLV